MSKYIPTASFTEKVNLPNDDSSGTHDENCIQYYLVMMSQNIHVRYSIRMY